MVLADEMAASVHLVPPAGLAAAGGRVAAGGPGRVSGAALIVPGPLVAAELEPADLEVGPQRALVLAHAIGRQELADLAPWRAAGLPDDVEALERGLAALASAPPQVDVNCGEGGAPFRFLLAQAAIAAGKRVRLHGSARLGERPRSALIEALRASLKGSGFRCSEELPGPSR